MIMRNMEDTAWGYSGSRGKESEFRVGEFTYSYLIMFRFLLTSWAWIQKTNGERNKPLSRRTGDVATRSRLQWTSKPDLVSMWVLVTVETATMRWCSEAVYSADEATPHTGTEEDDYTELDASPRATLRRGRRTIQLPVPRSTVRDHPSAYCFEPIFSQLGYSQTIHCLEPV